MTPPWRRRHVRGAAAVALLLAAWAPAPAATRSFSGAVTAVRSGDTVVVRVGAREHPVRLLGVDAPEPGAPFGDQARERTRGLTAGRRVTVRRTVEDARGRVVGVVVLPDGRDLGLQLVREGLARWNRGGAPDAAGLAATEAEARGAGRGVWGTGIGPAGALRAPAERARQPAAAPVTRPAPLTDGPRP